MAAKYENLTALTTAALDIDTTGDKAYLTVPFKCRVYRAQVTVTSTDAGGGTVGFDHLLVAGSTGTGANRTEEAVGKIVITAADNQGKCFYDHAGRGLILNEGDQIAVASDADPGTGPAFVATVIVDYIPEVESNNSAMVLTA